MQYKKFLIGEIAGKIGVNPKTIRYYEEINLLSRPERGSNNYRIYSEDTLKILKFIKKAKTFGFTLNEIKEILTLSISGYPCDGIGELLKEKINTINKKLEELKKIQSSIKKLENEWSKIGTSEQCVAGVICPKIDKYFLGH